MTIFQPVWISTDEHLKKFYAIYNQASILGKMFGVYSLPANYPYVHMFWGIFPIILKVPVVTIASGIGKIDDAKFLFQSKPFNPFGSTTKNLLDLEFDLDANELTQVTRTKGAESPLVQSYSIPFIRVQTKRDGLLNNFLVCVGGVGPSLKKINARSYELFQNLEKLLPLKG